MICTSGYIQQTCYEMFQHNKNKAQKKKKKKKKYQPTYPILVQPVMRIQQLNVFDLKLKAQYKPSVPHALNKNKDL